MTTKKVTTNNTKNEIIDAYNEMVARVKELESQKLDPAKEQSTKAAVQMLNQAEKTASTSVEDQIASLQKNVAGILGNLSNSFSEEIKNFKNLQDAIKLKEAELKELIDIEKEAFTLAALVNTRKELAAKFDAEQAEKEVQARQRLDEINEQMRLARSTAVEEINKLKLESEVARKREQEEYSYNFKRQKQQDLDSVNDEIALKRKQHEQEVEVKNSELIELEKTLTEREHNIETREVYMSELEAKIASFPEREAQIRLETEDRVKKEEARTAAIKESYAKKEAENQKNLHDSKVQMLEQNLNDEKAKNAELAKKLDEAYVKIQNMALASVNGAHEAKAFEKVAGMINEKK